MRRAYQNLKKHFVRWLYHQLKLIQAEEEGRPKIVKATLAENVVLYPDANVTNIQGAPSRIKIGKGSRVRGELLIYGHGGEILIGESCYVGLNTKIWSMDSITIGDRVMISHGVNIHDGTGHSIDPVDRAKHFEFIVKKGHPRSWEDLPGVRSASVTIEDDVWISFGVTILKGVKLGRGCVIAAGSVVTQDVPEYSMYRCRIDPVITPLSEIEARLNADE